MSEKTSVNLKPDFVPAENSEGEMMACCQKTIADHSLYNPMMVCNACHQIIKCFADERSLANYLAFCRTKGRPVTTGRVADHYVVIFDSSSR